MGCVFHLAIGCVLGPHQGVCWARSMVVCRSLLGRYGHSFQASLHKYTCIFSMSRLFHGVIGPRVTRGGACGAGRAGAGRAPSSVGPCRRAHHFVFAARASSSLRGDQPSVDVNPDGRLLPPRQVPLLRCGGAVRGHVRGGRDWRGLRGMGPSDCAPKVLSLHGVLKFTCKRMDGAQDAPTLVCCVELSNGTINLVHGTGLRSYQALAHTSLSVAFQEVLACVRRVRDGGDGFASRTSAVLGSRAGTPAWLPHRCPPSGPSPHRAQSPTVSAPLPSRQLSVPPPGRPPPPTNPPPPPSDSPPPALLPGAGDDFPPRNPRPPFGSPPEHLSPVTRPHSPPAGASPSTLPAFPPSRTLASSPRENATERIPPPAMSTTPAGSLLDGEADVQAPAGAMLVAAVATTDAADHGALAGVMPAGGCAGAQQGVTPAGDAPANGGAAVGDALGRDGEAAVDTTGSGGGAADSDGDGDHASNARGRRGEAANDGGGKKAAGADGAGVGGGRGGGAADDAG